MLTRTKVMVILALSLFPVQNGFAETADTKAKGTLVLRNFAPVDERIEGDLSLMNAPSGKLDLKIVQSVTKESLGFELKSTPVNLWVLVDASQLCQVNKIDQYLGAQLGELKRTLPPKSLFSVVSFTSTTLEIPHNHRPIGDVEEVSLHCEPTLLSTSYEKALARLLESSQDAGITMPTVVWIYTSGNVSLSEKMIASLKSKKINLHLILYNAILENDIRPLIDQANLKLGNDRVALSIFNPAFGFVPERWMRVAIDTPSFFKGGPVPLTLTASVEGNPVASVQATVNVPAPRSFWSRNRAWMIGLGLCVVLGFALYRLVRYYRPKFCKTCGKRRRHTDEVCGFCPKPGLAYLVGRFNSKDRRKFNRVDVLALLSPVVELGSHRRSRVKWLRASGERRSVYLTIERDTVAGKSAYRAKSNTAGKVQVNGLELSNPRYLAPGDEIQNRRSFDDFCL